MNDTNSSRSMRTISAFSAIELAVVISIILILVSTGTIAGAAWNDAWGNPLVIAYSLYQYAPETDTHNTSPPPIGANGHGNSQWAAAKGRYGITRSLLVTIGSLGPQTLDATTMTDLANAATRGSALNGLWQNVESVANRDSSNAAVWRVDADGTPVNAAINPPWKGVRRGTHSDGRLCLLSLPIELQ